MNLIRSVTKLTITRLSTKQCTFFAGDSWKERDEAAEKVYINRKEREALKRLLDQVDRESADNESSSQEFERRLQDIMTRYKLQNEALSAEISHLHRDLRQ